MRAQPSQADPLQPLGFSRAAVEAGVDFSMKNSAGHDIFSGAASCGRIVTLAEFEKETPICKGGLDVVLENHILEAIHSRTWTRVAEIVPAVPAQSMVNVLSRISVFSEDANVSSFGHALGPRNALAREHNETLRFAALLLTCRYRRVGVDLVRFLATRRSYDPQATGSNVHFCYSCLHCRHAPRWLGALVHRSRVKEAPTAIFLKTVF